MKKTMRNWCGRAAAVVAIALTATAVSAQTTWHVDGANACPGNGSVADPFCSIQLAIDIASSQDEIIVAPGTYNEAISLGSEGIHLRSSGGPAVTIIDASSFNTSVVACVGCVGETVIEGLTITGGSSSQGGGLFNFFGGPTVIDCVFIGNVATVGGAIANDSGSNTTIINCQFIDNLATNAGGAMHNINFSDPTVTDSVFSGNAANSGAAIWNSPGTHCNTHVAGTTFCNNGSDPIFGTWHDDGGNTFDPVADLNCDGVVDVSDLLALLAAWGDCPRGADCPADLNDDGVVDVSDLLMLLGNWG